MVKRLAVNQRIRAREVRVIGESGEQLGILPVQRAMQIAREHGLDLVEVAPTATPPVCRLLDYGKYKYDQTKKERSAKRGQRIGLLKELRLRPRIEEHDLQAKVRMARKFLEGGNKLRLLVIFRGREVVYPELGLKVLQRVSEALRDIAVVSAHPVREKRTITLTLSPISVKKPKEVKSDAEVENS